MKIKKIEISNLKAIDFQKIELNGCSVMVTGANQKGKTTLLQGMIDRIRGKRPSQIVKQGEKEGRGTMTLDNGEQFKWEFDNETLDKLTYITKDGHASRVTKEIALKYFPKPFNIDKFLVSQPKEQLTQLAELVGLDFESIDAEYLEAYNARTVKNKAEEVAKVKYESINKIPDKVDFVDSKTLVAEKQELTTKRENQYLKNKETNDGLREAFDLKKDEVRKAVKEFNDLQDDRATNILCAQTNYKELKRLGYEGLEVLRSYSYGSIEVGRGWSVTL